MTNEQEKAKELAKLLTAFADGKTIQYEYKGKWHNCQDNMWGIHDMSVKYNTRIKPETKRIALNQQDLIDRELSGKTMRVRKADSDFDSVLITLISKIGIAVYDCQQIITYEELKENFYWLDGTPCYKEVNNE